MANASFRRSLSILGLLQEARHCFEQIADPISTPTIPLVDHLMSGLAVFGLKYPRSLSENSQPTAEKQKSAIFHPRLR